MCAFQAFRDPVRVFPAFLFFFFFVLFFGWRLAKGDEMR